MLTDIRTHLHLPMKLRKFGAALLDQQLWCFGRDLRHPEGNALDRYGMQCARMPAKQNGSHAYTRAECAKRRVVLWGFGAFFGDDDLGGLFIRRYTIEPCLTPVARLELPLWRVAQLPNAAPPRSIERIGDAITLSTALFGWLAAYERWVGDTLGPGWRDACIDAWHRRRCTDGAHMPDAWLELRQQIEQLQPRQQLQSVAHPAHEIARDQR
jgi:hypothetical protein